mmetsp:Transcript_104746/g.223903  ORF Transcript_104746/g.223903 Transcript_104746/m.223903 type:complete len:97 (-) Transcript_104746:28-318(-)
MSWAKEKAEAIVPYSAKEESLPYAGDRPALASLHKMFLMKNVPAWLQPEPRQKEIPKTAYYAAAFLLPKDRVRGNEGLPWEEEPPKKRGEDDDDEE